MSSIPVSGTSQPFQTIHECLSDTYKAHPVRALSFLVFVMCARAIDGCSGSARKPAQALPRAPASQSQKLRVRASPSLSRCTSQLQFGPRTVCSASATSSP